MSNSIINLNTEGGYFKDDIKEEIYDYNFMYINTNILIRAYQKDKNKLTFLNRRLNLIKIVGFVINIEEKKEFLLYTIDDTTGYLKAKLLLTYPVNNLKEITEIIGIDDLVQIFGICNFVSFNEDLTISINSIKKLNSINYLCHHQLLVFHSYLKSVEEEKKKKKIEMDSIQNFNDVDASLNIPNENDYPFFKTFF
ncbi:conserved protein, unknown function [Hepatocystis sp. ex Piliocolobus tephrosceles]|nr:conserved protein, unknown function [Hepatocystis sp. ex Piliocolobus tephrosceles]